MTGLGGPTLTADARTFQQRAEQALPGRLAGVLADRVARLHGDADAPLPPGDLTDAERVAIEIAEQFVVDVHGLTDAAFERFRDHYSDAEIVAVMFHLACLDGFGKLASLDVPSLSEPVAVAGAGGADDRARSEVVE